MMDGPHTEIDGQGRELVRLEEVQLKYPLAERVRSQSKDADPPGLAGITTQWRESEIIGIVGPNGAGKSTLLRVVAGTLPATAGEVRVHGVPLLLQAGAGIRGELTGRENARWLSIVYGTPRERRLELEERAKDMSGLAERFEWPVYTYSAGMKSRLSFAVACSTSFDILLIDEALSAGDAAFRRTVDAELERVRANARLVVIVSHSLGKLQKWCTRIIFIEQGRVRADGDPETVIKEYEESID